MTEQEALLVLNAVPDLGAVRIRKLMAFFGNALEVLRASIEELSQSGVLPIQAAENIFHFSKDSFHLEKNYCKASQTFGQKSLNVPKTS